MEKYIGFYDEYGNDITDRFVVNEFLIEGVKSIRNLCDAFLICHEYGRDDLLYTLAEDIHYTAQTITEEYCTKEESCQH